MTLRARPTHLLPAVASLCRDAASAILEVYAAGASQPDWKADGTPITAADRAAHRVLVAGLRALTPEVPVISEEDAVPRRAMPGPDLYWLVDPLDGTKEFVKRTGEFTVNVALIDEGRPVLGVVQAPVAGTLWMGAEEGGATVAERVAADGERRTLTCGPVDPARLRVAASRSHGGRLVEAIEAGAVPGAEVVRAGSSLKFCLVAEGRADLYLRDGPTMPWDTAAAHCVLACAGGAIRELDGSPLVYGDPTRRNPPFLAVADPHCDTRELLRLAASG